jgi:hypothetical protein
VDEDGQESLFGGSAPEPNHESDSAGEDLEQPPPAAGPGQLTLEPAFDYRSARRSGQRPHRRLSLRAAIAVLDSEQRMAGAAAIGIALSLFAPWWERPGKGDITNAGVSHFYFIELTLLLVCASVLLLLYRRAEARSFHLPLADGTLAALAGIWCSALIVFRMFDPPVAVVGGVETGYELHWGIFLALGFAILMAYAGVHGRQRYHAGESEAVAADEDAIPTKEHVASLR